MTWQRVGVSIVVGLLLVLVMAVVLVRCPWSACRYVNLNTYTISTLLEYRQFLSNEAAFKAGHRVGAVTLDCAALRDDVVTALQSGRLTIGLNEQGMAKTETAKPGLLRAWRQGLVLHVMNTMSADQRQQETWAERVQEIVGSQEQDGLSFLPRLFGGLIIHIQNKQKPITLFSAERCPE